MTFLRVLITSLLILLVNGVNGKSCQPSQFYVLKIPSERYVSTCTTLATFRATVTLCQRYACWFNSDVIMYREETCTLQRCGTIGPQLENRATGWHIYVRDTETPCSYANDRTLSCFTCKAANDDTECMQRGRMEPCKFADSTCFYERRVGRRLPFHPGKVFLVNRGCHQRSRCNDQELSPWGECVYNRYYADCRYCFYGNSIGSHHCTEGGSLSGAKDPVCHRQFYMFGLRTETTISACTQISYSEGYSTASCWRYACTMGGNTINYRASDGACDVRLCTSNDLMTMEMAEGGYQLYTSAADIKCDASMDKVLACWVCDSATDRDCSNNGNMADCDEPNSICGYEKTIDRDNLVSNVRRWCRPLDSCSNQELLPAPGHCKAYQYGGAGKPGNQCSQCMYEVSGSVYACHDPFDIECHERFQRYTLVDGPLSPCQEITTASSHWLQSCFQLACEVGGNVIYHNKQSRMCTLRQCTGSELILEDWSGYTIWAKDPDECDLGTYTCGDNSVCVDQIPGYKCECQPGFEGNGTLGCTDINECVNDEDLASCGESAECINTEGSFICQCPAGFVGDPYINCTDVDECLLENGGCDAHAHCYNLPGARACSCITGYQGDGTNCVGDPCQCELKGDPEATTYDGATFPLVGEKRYLVSENTDQDATCRFSVHVETRHRQQSASGHYYMEHVILSVRDVTSGNVHIITVDEESSRVRYQTAEAGAYQELPVPSTVGDLRVGAAPGGSVSIVSTSSDCVIELTVRLDVLEPANALVQLMTSRDYELSGVCGNCNSLPDEYQAITGDDLTHPGAALQYINNMFGTDL